MNAQLKLTRDAFRIDAQDWCNDIADLIEEKIAESNRDGIVVTISGGLDSSRNCGQLGMDEQPVNKLQEAVRLSATSRNHALAPILSY